MLQLQFSRLWLHLLQWRWGKGFTGFGTLHQGQVTETGAEGLVSAERCPRQIRSCGQDGSCGAVECRFTWEGQSSSSTHCGFWRHLRTCLGLLPPKAPTTPALAQADAAVPYNVRARLQRLLGHLAARQLVVWVQQKPSWIWSQLKKQLFGQSCQG